MLKKIEQDEQTRKNQKYLQYSLTGISFSVIIFSLILGVSLLFKLNMLCQVMPYFILIIGIISIVATTAFSNLNLQGEGKPTKSVKEVVKKNLALISLGNVSFFVSLAYVRKPA